MPYFKRRTTVALLLEKADEFESDARARFSGDVVDGNIHQLEECLASFRELIEDITKSNCLAHQLEELAYRIDGKSLVSSQRETFTELVIDLVWIAKIDPMAYPGILLSDQHVFLALLLRIASNIGLSRNQFATILSELKKNGNPRERYWEIERQVEILMECSPDYPISISLIRLQGLPPRPFKFDDCNQLIITSNLFNMPHYMSEELAVGWESIKEKLYGFTRREFDQDVLVVLEEVWELLNSAHEALMNVPVGFVDLDAELSSFISALNDVSVLLKNTPNTNHQEEMNQGIIEKLKSIIPIFRGYEREAFPERLEMRSRLVDKIRLGLSGGPETLTILEPLLVKLADVNLVSFFGRNKRGLPKYTEQLINRSIALLDIQIDLYIEIIQRGETFGFPPRMGVGILVDPSDWFSDTNKKIRAVLAACIELRCTEVRDDILDSLTYDQVNDLGKVLRKFVSRRNALLYLNVDQRAPLVSADYILMAVASQDEQYQSWVTEHLFVDHWEIFRTLDHQQGVLNEHIIQDILTYLDLPESLIFISKRAAFVYRTYRRKIGGVIGERLNGILSACLDFPRNLLRLEILWELYDVENADDLNFRNLLEAVFMDLLDWVELAAANIVILHEERASDIIKSLQTQLARGSWWLFPRFDEYERQLTNLLKKEIGEFSAKMKLETEALKLTRFPTLKPA